MVNRRSSQDEVSRTDSLIPAALKATFLLVVLVIVIEMHFNHHLLLSIYILLTLFYTHSYTCYTTYTPSISIHVTYFLLNYNYIITIWSVKCIRGNASARGGTPLTLAALIYKTYKRRYLLLLL